MTTSGPLFDGRARSAVRQLSRTVIGRIVRLGEQRLDRMLRPRPAGVFLSVDEAGRGKASTGHYRRSVHPVVADTWGRIDDGGVVYGPWLEGTSGRNRTTRFKGYSSFRRTRRWLQTQAGKVLSGAMSGFRRQAN